MIGRLPPTHTAAACAESLPRQGAAETGARVRIVADDLTGAADAAAAFARTGRSAGVLLTPGAQPSLEVTAFSTDSRGLPAAAAARRVRQAVEWHAPGAGATIRFQKIDSVLRGNVGAEIAAALDAWRASCAVVAPSLPGQGRVVEDGWLRGVTDASVAPQHVPTLLGSQGLTACQLISRGIDARAMADSLRAARSGARILVCDAVTDADLECIAAAGQDLDDVLWVGSSGLAAALARHAARQRRATASAVRPTPKVSQVVLLIGSTHPITERQQARLRESGDAVSVAVTDAVGAVRVLGRGEHLLVSIDRDASGTALMRLLDAILELAPAAGFVMSGGDTAARICRALEGERFRIEGEVEEGIPWGWLSSRWRQWPLVLKSGGFGTTEALRRAVALLMRTGTADA